MQRGDIFSDHFESTELSRWTDMKAWGLGVWQVQDEKLVSIDPENPDAGMVAILPQFENAIVNRDFSAFIRFMPVRGTAFSFMIDFRQQGVNGYQIHILEDGSVSIVKRMVARLLETSFRSQAGVVIFDNWQWLRLDVRGESPLAIGAKIWQGNLDNEPQFFQAVYADDAPLSAQQMSFAMTMIQNGGAHVIIDQIDIYSKISPSSIWKWMDNEQDFQIKSESAFQSFQRGELTTAEIMLKSMVSSPMVLKNLA
ncbi:MAG: hypothetical protein SCK70_16900, partial [bacterium]|nr:hypothetical protein [bacterium]